MSSKHEHNGEMNFDDLPAVEVPVTYGGKTYTLREATEDTSIRFRSMQLRNAKLVDGKLQASVENLAESQAFLVSRCLFDVEGKILPLNVIKAWPARFIKALFERVMEISRIAEEEDTPEKLEKQLAATQAKLDALRNGQEDEAKNSPAGATDTSE